MVVILADEQPDQSLQINGQTRYSLRRRSEKAKIVEVEDSNARKRGKSASNKIDRPAAARKRKTETPQLRGSVVSDDGEEVADSTAKCSSRKRGASAAVEKKRNTAKPQLNGAVVADDGDGVADSAARVTETLRNFNKYYLHFVQQEDNRYDERENMKKDLKSSNKPAKRLSKRPDLRAASQMITNGAVLYPKKTIGCLPGIDVGRQFFSRAEMMVLGFHQHSVGGIDFIGGTTKLAIKGYTLPLAVSIVLSGQYEDDLDNCEDIVYTGQGGNDLLGNKRQVCDQELKRGNLALKNSMEQSVPVRVVRGHKCPSSYAGKVYTYDGLYDVVEFWPEKGVAGFTVYKFRLKRCEGQPALETEVVYFSRGPVPRSVSDTRGLVCEDITGGVEVYPIPVTNSVDDTDTLFSLGYIYIKNRKFSNNVTPPAPIEATGCKCKGDCTDPRICACAKLNGGDFPYVRCHGGRLIEPKSVVFECGPNCGCGPKCVNRISQNGIRFRLEVFRTQKKGWGVRSWDYIPSGAPICEYIGLIRRTDELNRADDNSYVFDIDCLQTMKGLEGRESRLRDVCLPTYLKKMSEEATETVPFCIDAAETGNIARFINHSCQPNLFVQCVLTDHHDPKLARVVLIAADNIPPLKELTYDYAYELDSVLDLEGNVRQMRCFCGADGCRKRLY